MSTKASNQPDRSPCISEHELWFYRLHLKSPAQDHKAQGVPCQAVVPAAPGGPGLGAPRARRDPARGAAASALLPRPRLVDDNRRRVQDRLRPQPLPPRPCDNVRASEGRDSFQIKSVKYYCYPSSLSQCFFTVVAKNCECMLGQLVATVAAHHPGDSPKSSSLKPCDRLDE